jgi:hypothetical protein
MMGWGRQLELHKISTCGLNFQVLDLQIVDRTLVTCRSILSVLMYKNFWTNI